MKVVTRRLPMKIHRANAHRPFAVRGQSEECIPEDGLLNGTFPGNGTLFRPRRALYRGMKRKTKLQTNAIDSVSLTIISPSSTPIDVLETVIAVAATVKCAIDTIVSVREIIIGETPIIMSGPDTIISIPDTIIGGTPAIVSGSEIFIFRQLILISVPQIVICGRTLDSRNQPVADMPREISISVTEILISAAEMIINKPATIISKRETVMSAPDTVMSGPHLIIYRRDASPPWRRLFVQRRQLFIGRR